MTLSNIQPEQAWRMVLDQLQMEMPKGSFDTWLRDTEFVAFEDGILTVGASNSYACEWLADRLTSTVNRMVTGILDQPITIRFVVHEKPLPEENDSVEEENPESDSPPAVLTLQAAYQSVYDEIVQPDQVIVIPGYFLRYIPMLGLELSWLYIGFRQAAYEAGASKRPGKKIGARAKKVARYSGISPRTFWRWAGKPDTWKLLHWLVKPVEEKTHWTRGSDGRPHQATHYYQVAMTMPLTPFDELSLRAWLYRKLGEGKKPLAFLGEALETPMDELLPWPEEMPSLDEVTGEPHSVQDVLQAVCSPIAEDEQAQFNSLSDKLAQHLMPPKDLVFLTHYFFSHWLPRLGPGPGLFVTLIRDRCYLNQRTGEIRDEVRLDQGYAEAARWLGLKRVKTIWEWLRSEEVSTFVRETSRENGDWEESPRSFKVCLGEPMVEKDQERANRAIAKRSVGASDTHSYSEGNSSVGAGVTHSETADADMVGATNTHSNDSVGASDTHNGATGTHMDDLASQQIGASVTHSGATDTHSNGSVGATDTLSGATDIHRDDLAGQQIGASVTHSCATDTHSNGFVGAGDIHNGVTDTHKHGASVTPIGALDTHTIGASGTIDWRYWHSLNSLTPGFKHLNNTQTTSSDVLSTTARLN